MKLHLGVMDGSHGDTETIAEVAQYLEDKYDVMQNFFDAHAGDIADDFAKSFAIAIEDMMSGLPVGNPFNSATSKTEARFQKFIDLAEIEKMGIEGVPTQAALDGVRSSLKKKKEIKGRKYRSKVRGTRRQSFFDTGLYMNAFKCWVDQ